MKCKDPYISFIGFARNDDYVPDRAKRHSFSLQLLIDQLEEKKIPSEIIIVEWNYSEEKARLAETISIESSTEWTRVRVIRVPSRYHRQYKFWQSKVFHVGAAVNVGIRRALGKFVLPIASDVFFTESCLEIIAKQDLDENCFYRCDRCDIDPIIFNKLETSEDKSRNAFFQLCESHVLDHHKKILQDSSYCIADLHTNACGDFCLVSRKKIEEIRGFKEGIDVGGLDIDSLVLHALKGLGCHEKILPEECKVYKIFHPRSTARSVQRNMDTSWVQKLDVFLNRWGFSGKTINSFRILLNYPKRSFSYAPNAIFDSFEKNFVKPARRWAKKRPPFALNRADWGLRNEKFEENEITLFQAQTVSG